MRSLHDEIIVDSFAGGGGASTGIEMALGRSPDVAINHDETAVAMHQVNHPDTEHYCQNIWQANPKDVARGRPVGLAWFSPDCKHFSKAKGSKPVNRNIRDLAWVVPMWAEQVKPRVIVVENVEEFLGWGPLDENELPCKERKGETFDKWVKAIRRAGYKVQWRELRGSDYGAPTIRKRLFVIARCDGAKIVWPKATHYNPHKKGIRKKGLQPWRAVSECIDWSIPCPSIFMTKEDAAEWRKATGQSLKRPLAEATMRRIAQGIRRFVLEAERPFIVTANHQGTAFRGQGIDEPFKTITAARDAHGIVTPLLTEHANASAQRTFSPDEPLRTQCANVKGGHFALVSASLASYYGTKNGADLRTPPIDEPLRTQTTENRFAVAQAFMVKHFGGVVGTSLDKPSPTVTTRATQNQIVTATIERQFGKSTGNAATDPIGALTTQNKSALVASSLVKLRGSCKDGQSIDKPAPTITAGGNHVGEVRAFLQKYYGCEKSQQQACDVPLDTIPTKDRFGLITINGTQYHIADIGMRMLTPRELFRAQGFPENYEIDRKPDGSRITKTAQVSCVGNSVCPPLAMAIVGANVPEMAIERRAAE